MSGGAGGKILSGFLLTNVNPGVTPVSASGTIGPDYGVYGQNDSFGFAADIRGYTKFKFQLVQIGTDALSGYTVSIYGTIDPNAYQTYFYALQGRNPQGNSALPFGGSPNALADAASGFLPGIPATSWTLLDGFADQSGAGMSANPLTDTTPWFNGAGPVSAIRAVVTGADTPVGVFSVAMQGIP